MMELAFKRVLPETFLKPDLIFPVFFENAP